MPVTSAHFSLTRRGFTAGLGALPLARPALAATPIDGGHFACFTNPGEFVPTLRKLTDPLVQRG